MYRSKFNIWNVYVVIFLVVVLLIFGFLFILQSPELNGKITPGEKRPPLFLGICMIPFAAFLLYKGLQKALAVNIESDHFNARSLFTKYNFTAEEIKSIELFSRIKSRTLNTGYLSDGINIILKNGKAFFLYGEYFREKDRLRQAFKEFAERNKKDIGLIFPEKITALSTISFNAEKERFAGNYWLSAGGISLISVVIIFFIIYPRQARGGYWLYEYICGSFIMFYAALSIQSDYFIIEANQLIIKNQMLFWVKKEYDIENIVKVFFEAHYKRSNALQIVLQDCRSRTFYAGSLSNKHWLKLKNKFTDFGIPVQSDFDL